MNSSNGDGNRNGQGTVPKSSGTARQRNTLRTLLVVDPRDRRIEIRAALVALEDPQLEIIDVEPGFASGANGAAPPADVEMVVFGVDEEAALAHLRGRAAHSPRPALFALLPERAPALMRRVLRSGADEVLFLPLDVGEATRALLKVSESRWRSERGGHGTICSFTSTVGGIGVSTVAANLALALRHSLDKRVAVVDLDLQEGGLGLFLNLEPEHTISDLTDPSEKLDSIQLELALTKHPSGIYLLAAPRRIEDSELVTEGMVGPLLELMRQLFDYVIVDCGRYANEVSLAAWVQSDRLFYVVDQSLGSIRCALRFVDLFRRLKVQVEPQFVLNSMVANHAISVEQVAQTLTHPLYVRIPRDDANLERVQWGARDLWQVAPRSPLVQAFEEFATRLAAGGVEVPAPPTGLVSRLLGVLGRN
jgi:pilus assembly protein CpaE